MKTSKAYWLGAAGALLFAARAAYGDIANGTYTFTAPGTVPIWDISGIISGGLEGIDLGFTVTEKSDGTLSGNGPFTFGVISGNVTVTGKVSGSSAKTGVTMDLVLSGSGLGVDLKAKGKFLFAVDGPKTNLILISGSASVTEVSTLTGQKVSEPVHFHQGDTLGLPGDATGGWGLTLNVTPNGAKLTGTATVQTAPGETVTFTVKGTYSAKTDTSKITLKGDGNTLSLDVSTSGSTMTVNSIKGKLFGQSISLTNP